MELEIENHPARDAEVVFGDARDTYCAFESMRILGALDRVEDLDKWQFRLWGPQRTPDGKIGW